MKYIVIFKAQIKTLDEIYSQTAQQLREKAFEQYQCQRFESVLENGFEITLSYWNSLDDIRRWHQDAEHQIAQGLGKERWYSSFSVEITEIIRHYHN